MHRLSTDAKDIHLMRVIFMFLSFPKNVCMQCEILINLDFLLQIEYMKRQVVFSYRGLEKLVGA